MKEFINKLIDRLEEEHEKCINRYGVVGGNLPASEVKQCMEIINQLAEEYNNGWIPCSQQMPPQPKENPVFQNQPLELYLVTERDADYPRRVFWNGEFFTDGWEKADVIAWQPLPKPYQPKGE